MKRALAIFLCVAVMAALFSGCRKKGVSALYFAVPGGGGSFDPQIVENGAANLVVRNCFEGLVYPDANGDPEPAAAVSWEVSEDKRVYTFHLRENAKWHLSATAAEDLGDVLPKNFAPEVTADDFVFALQRAVDPVTRSPQAKRLSNITGAAEILAGSAKPETLGVKAKDAHTLVITLVRAEPGFLETLSEPLCMPCNRVFFEATGGRYGLRIKYLIANGPFYLTKFEDNTFRLAKNPDYTGPHAAKTDVIWLYGGKEESAAIESLTNGDYTGAVLSESAAASVGLKNPVATGAWDLLRGFLFNCKNEDLANEELRAAFFYASGISELCKANGKDPANAVCPKTLGTADGYAVKADPDAAAAHLNAALKALKKTDVAFTLLCEPQFENSLRYFLQEWQKSLGIHCGVSLETVTAAEMEKRVRAGEYDIAFYPVRAEDRSPVSYFEQFSALSSRSICSYADEDYDAAVSALRFPGENTFSDMQTRFWNAHLLLPVWHEQTVLLCRAGVNGVRMPGGEDRLYLFDAYSD